MPGPLLVLAAYAPELKALPARRLPKDGRVATALVGIGAVEAAAGAMEAIAEVRPAAVILVGTAGLYPGAPATLAIGQAVLVRRMFLASLTVARGLAYLPGPLPDEASSDVRLRRDLARSTGLPLADVACPVGITGDARAARDLQRATGATLENLEAFSVARAAARAHVPFAAILGIANRVGPTAHTEWKKHAALAAATACTALMSALPLTRAR